MTSVVGAFYYIRIIKIMYFDEPVHTEAIHAPADIRVVLSINGALVLLIGMFPGGLMALCARAVASMMAA